MSTQKSQSTTIRLKCPACGTEIRETEELARPDIVYRCPVCRLDFVRHSDKLTLTLAPAPFTWSNPDTPEQRPPLNESRNTAPALDGGSSPPNLIRERVPLEVDRAADEAKPRVWPTKAASRAHQRKRRTGT
jgi:hypothetical protein